MNVETINKNEETADSQQNMSPHPSIMFKDGVWGYYVIENDELKFCPVFPALTAEKSIETQKK